MTVCYINFNLQNPRDRIAIRGLQENGVTVKEISDRAPGLRKYFVIARAFMACKQECDLVMVGYVGAALVPLIRALTRKKIIYNALSSLYDGMIISRGKGWRYYLIDLVAFRCADRTLLECRAQKDLVARAYRIDPAKLSVHWLGADDVQFYADPAVPKRARFTAVFRGAFLPESGAEVAVRAAKELEREDIDVRIIGRGLRKKEIERLVAELAPKNLELVTALLPADELRASMLECHVSLGQLADHPRVHTTIPHKAFESMSMKLPYVTGKNNAVLEILADGETCFTVPPGDHMSLARMLVALRDRPAELARVSQNAYELYQREFTPRALGRAMLEELQAI